MTRARAVIVLAMAFAGCGKKGPPLAPFQPDPLPVADLKAGQQGDKLLVTYTAPRQTVDQQPLEVFDVEILVASRPGELAKVATIQTVRVAAGESRTELLPLPEADLLARVAGRARNKGRRSTVGQVVTLKVQPPPAGPTAVEAKIDPAGIIVTWPTVPPTATPTPSPSPSPTATPTPSARATGTSTVAAAVATPTPTPKPLSGYLVRRRGPTGVVLLTEKPIASPPFLDDKPLPVGRWCYSVRWATSMEPLVTSAESPEGCVDLKEARPPAPRPGP
jgi:hypothetical protein